MCQYRFIKILLMVIWLNVQFINCAENESNCTNNLSFKVPTCPPNYTLVNGLCYLYSHVPTTSCPTGYQLYNNSFCYPLASQPCVPNIRPVPNGNPSAVEQNESEQRCPSGSVFMDGQCRKLVCSQGEYYMGRCLEAACPNGMVWRGRRCQDPEYITTILEIENVFVNEKVSENDKAENSNEIDVQLVTGSPVTGQMHIKTYFNKSVISNNLDIEVKTQLPLYTEKDIKAYFNKTVLKPQSENLNNSENLDIEVIVKDPANDFDTTQRENSGKRESLDIEVIVKDPIKSTAHNSSESSDKQYFNKEVLSQQKLELESDNAASSGDIDVNVMMKAPVYLGDEEKTTTTTTTVRNVLADSVGVSENATSCCTVYTPRICKQHGKRWLCFNRSYKLCDVKLCTHEVIYIKSPEIIYKSAMLIMPPNPPLPACASNNCDSTTNCSGCASYQRETCSSYCYRYLCPQDSCAYMDQQLFCTLYAGKFGCVERDGCIWSWCHSPQAKI